MNPHDFTFASRPLRQVSVVRLALTLVLGGCLFMASAVRAETGREPWTLLEQNAQAPVLGEGRSAIIFLQMRDSAADTAQPDYTLAASRGATVSVFIDGNYHASLPRASWAYAEVCPGSHFLNAVQDKTVLAVQENVPYGQRHEFPVASTSYFQLLEDEKGAPRLQAVDASAAQQVVQQLPRAAHTISRVPVAGCTPVVEARPVVVAPVQMRNYTLQAATLFAHDKYTFDSMRKSKSQIDGIIQDVRARDGEVQRIEIKGYADPTGSAAYNLKLSQERAQTVAQYFIKAGFPGNIVTARGLGATELVVSDCSARLKTKAQINACNEPNRRVEVMVQKRSAN